MWKTCLVLALAVSPLAVRGQQLPGVLTASIDGQNKRWSLSANSEPSPSYWSGDEATTRIVISAGNEGATVPDASLLTISFSVIDRQGTSQVTEVDVVYSPDPNAGAFVTQGHGAGSLIDLETLMRGGDQLRLSGKFEVELFYTDDFGASLDLENSRNISGSFDVALPRK